MRKTFCFIIAIIIILILIVGVCAYLNNESRPSAEAELTNISIAGLSVSKSGSAWSTTVPYSMNSIDIANIASTKSAKSSISYNGKTSGTINLLVGLNPITIVVTAEDGKASNNYALNITREDDSTEPSTEADLTDISISGLSVSKTGSVWSTTVPYSMDSIDIASIASTKSAKSSIFYNGKTSGTINLLVGLNTVTIVVTAEDGITSNNYTLNITREEEPEPLPEHINVKEWSETLNQNAVGDGIVDDSNAIRLALKKAQDTGVALYFPAGTYFCNDTDLNINTSTSGANSRIGKNIYLFGAGKEDTILLSPGILRGYNDITLKNMSIHKRTGIFIYHLPDEGIYGNVTIKNCKIYGSEMGDNCQFYYNTISSLAANKGVNHVVFTNNNANFVRNVLRMCCKVKSGLIDGNTLTNLSTGPSDVNLPIRGLAVGNTDPDNNWIKATNVIISNNYIKGVYNNSRQVIDGDEDGAPDLTYPIIAIGENITIINNHVEDLNKYTGIYSKATNLLIKGNTLINAGIRSSICVKVGIVPNHGDNHSLLASDLIIEDNIISSNVDGDGAIRVHAPYYTIRNNVIEQYDNDNKNLLGLCNSISIRTRATIDGVIEGNTIYTEALNAIRFVDGISGKVLIKNNNIHQNSISANITSSSDGSSAIEFRVAQLGSVIDCVNNTIIVERARYGINSAGAAGSLVNFSNNTITTYNVAASVTSFWYMTSVIDNNEFIAYGCPPGALFNFYAPFTFTKNKITFEEDAKVNQIIYCRTSAATQSNVATDITLIANNTVVCEAQGTGSSRTVAANYFIYITTASDSNLFPQIYINDNDIVVNNALISKGNNTAILCASTIEISRNNISRILTSSNGIYYNFNDVKYILGTGANQNTVIQL